MGNHVHGSSHHPKVLQAPLPMGNQYYRTDFWAPCGIAFSHSGMLAISESLHWPDGAGGHQVKLWMTFEDFERDTPPIVIGGETQQNNPPAFTYNPESVAFDSSGNLFVTDTGGHRILVFMFPFHSGMSATCVLGQIDFNESHVNPNRGPTESPGPPTADGLYNPRGLAFDSNGNLFVADDDNNRVLRFKNSRVLQVNRSHKSLGFHNGQSADLVIGQPDFTSRAPTQLSSPKAVAIDNEDNLYVAEYNSGIVSRWAPPYNTPVMVADGPAPVDLTFRPWGRQLLVTFQQLNQIKGFGDLEAAPPLTLEHEFEGSPGDPFGSETCGVASNGNNVVIADYGNDRVLVVQR